MIKGKLPAHANENFFLELFALYLLTLLFSFFFWLCVSVYEQPRFVDLIMLILETKQNLRIFKVNIQFN